MDKEDHNSRSNDHSKELNSRKNHIIRGNTKKPYQETSFERTRERQWSSLYLLGTVYTGDESL